MVAPFVSQRVSYITVVFDIDVDARDRSRSIRPPAAFGTSTDKNLDCRPSALFFGTLRCAATENQKGRCANAQRPSRDGFTAATERSF